MYLAFHYSDTNQQYLFILAKAKFSYLTTYILSKSYNQIWMYQEDARSSQNSGEKDLEDPTLPYKALIIQK